MQYERNGDLSDEGYFVGCNTPGALAFRYKLALTSIADRYDRRLAFIAETHEKSLEAELPNPEPYKINALLYTAQMQTQRAIMGTSRRVGKIMWMANEKATPMLSGADRYDVILVRSAISRMDTENVEADDIWQRKISGIARIALDKDLLGAYRKNIRWRGSQAFSDRIRGLASGPGAAAMLAAADEEVFIDVSNAAYHHGVDHERFTEALTYASSDNARQAVRAWFDRGVLTTAQRYAEQFSANNEQVHEVLSIASCPAARRLFAWIIGADLPDDPDMYDQMWHNPYSDMSTEDFMRAALRDGRFGQPLEGWGVPTQRRTTDRFMDIIQADGDSRPWPSRADPSLN